MLLEASRNFSPGASSALSQPPHGGERPEQATNIREGKGSSVGFWCHHQALLPTGPGHNFWKGRRPWRALCVVQARWREKSYLLGVFLRILLTGEFSLGHRAGCTSCRHPIGSSTLQNRSQGPCGGVPTCLTNAAAGKRLGTFPAHDQVHTVALKSCNAESWRSTHRAALIWRPFISNTIPLLCCFMNILPKYMFNAAQLQNTNTCFVRDPMVHWKPTHVEFLQYVSYNRVWASYTLSKSLCNETLVKDSKTLF